MIKNLNIGALKCECVRNDKSDVVTYMIYPAVVSFDQGWIERMSTEYGVSIVMVYVPSDDWNNFLTPWPEPGEEKGFPPFAGQASEFLKTIQEKVIPEADEVLGLSQPQRDLIGVSLSGLFTLWEWMICDTFHNIGSLSGSFWYSGFIDWFKSQTVPPKKGKAFFLLGKEEPKANIKAYRSVGVNTEAVVERLKESGIMTIFDWVPGNHFANPVPRAELAFKSLYGSQP